jgi:hypothetical protein
MFAFMTKPSNFANPVGFGFTAFTMIGTAVSTMIGVTTPGSCAATGEQNNAVPHAANNAQDKATGANAGKFIPMTRRNFIRYRP